MYEDEVKVEEAETPTYQDETLVCVECGKEFIFSAGEQAFYAEKGYTNKPKRCKACRDAKKNAGNPERQYMREYGGTEAGKITYANFFDGIYTSYRASKRNDGYAAVAMIPTMKISGFYRSMAADIVEWNNLRFPVSENNLTVSTLDSTPIPLYTVTLKDGYQYTWYLEKRYEKPIWEVSVDPETGVAGDPVKVGTEKHRSTRSE